MPKDGNISIVNNASELIQSLLPAAQPGAEVDRLSAPFAMIVDLDGDATLHKVQNPSDSDCLVAAILKVDTVDATETMDIGVDSDGTTSNDTLLDGISVATAGIYTSLNATDQGTNGQEFIDLDKKNGSNDYLVWQASAGTDTLAGKLVFICIPVGD